MLGYPIYRSALVRRLMALLGSSAAPCSSPRGPPCSSAYLTTRGAGLTPGPAPPAHHPTRPTGAADVVDPPPTLKRSRNHPPCSRSPGKN